MQLITSTTDKLCLLHSTIIRGHTTNSSRVDRPSGNTDTVEEHWIICKCVALGAVGKWCREWKVRVAHDEVVGRGMFGVEMGLLTMRDVDLILFFFFQAEDGIRDLTVTGVQTCALPI